MPESEFHANEVHVNWEKLEMLFAGLQRNMRYESRFAHGKHS